MKQIDVSHLTTDAKRTRFLRAYVNEVLELEDFLEIIEKNHLTHKKTGGGQWAWHYALKDGLYVGFYDPADMGVILKSFNKGFASEDDMRVAFNID